MPEFKEKPGYKRTELWALVAYGAYDILGKVGVSPADAKEVVDAAPGLIQKYLTGDPITKVMVGVGVVAYIYSRLKIKTAKIIAEAKYGGNNKG